MEPILSGTRVLDFGRFIAGPYCASLLSYLGAEVIRIERPGGSEDRFLAPITEEQDGALFMQVNANKLGLTLHIAKPEGRAIVKKLVATADVVVANLPPDVLQKLELDLDSLRAIKPDIILAANSTFGHSGPYANKPGFDGVAQAMSGAAHFSGHPGAPAKSSVHWVDFSSGLASALGVVAALLQKERTGTGQAVETSLLATALTLNNGALIEQAVIEANRVPTGNRGQTAAPADIFKTRDGHVIVQLVGPYIYKRWAELMGEEHWLTDPRFQDDISRGNHAEIFSARMAEWCGERTNAQALAELEAARLPCGPVLDYQSALDDPHAQALGQYEPMPYPGAPKPPPVAKAPFHLSETPVELRHRAPTVGEHTEQVLIELGYDAATIKQLRSDGIV